MAKDGILCLGGKLHSEQEETDTTPKHRHGAAFMDTNILVRLLALKNYIKNI